jgi:hypothetical protein
MSWFRNLIGDVKHVAASVEKEAVTAVKNGDNAVNVKVAELEKDFVKKLGEGFEVAGKKVDELGNALNALGVHIESNGHFDAGGVGTATIKITSAITAAAPAVAPEPEQSTQVAAGSSAQP